MGNTGGVFLRGAGCWGLWDVRIEPVDLLYEQLSHLALHCSFTDHSTTYNTGSDGRERERGMD